MDSRQLYFHQTIRQMQHLFMKCEELQVATRVLLFHSNKSELGAALVALGLCLSAREQLLSAFLNLGIEINGLQEIWLDENACGAADTVCYFNNLRRMSRLIERSLSADLDFATHALAILADETVSIVTLTLARAEAHLISAEKLKRASAA